MAVASVVAAGIAAAATWRTDDSTAGVNAARRAGTPVMFSSLSLEETIRRFFDARLDPTEPRRFSHRMVQAGSTRTNETGVANESDT